MKWIAFLIIFAMGTPAQVVPAKHEPFNSQQECLDWLITAEPSTNELISSLIDHDVPVLGHATVCIQPEDDTDQKPKTPA